jgi:hypothetical protein
MRRLNVVVEAISGMAAVMERAPSLNRCAGPACALYASRPQPRIVAVTIDSPERIAQAFPLVDELTSERGLVTSELVPANMPLATRL